MLVTEFTYRWDNKFVDHSFTVYVNLCYVAERKLFHGFWQHF